MITVFVKDKLLLVGGVGRYRQKLQSVDIYDIHTGDSFFLILHNAYINITCKVNAS